MLVGQPVVVATPWQVVLALAALIPQGWFWGTIWTTFWHIGVGFLLAVMLGAGLAGLASQGRWADALVAPPIRTLRAVPVVSFIILLLIWGGSSWLSTAVSALMVLPAVFDNLSEGLSHPPAELCEMAAVFKVPKWRRFRAIIAPGLWPYLMAACRVGVGLAWKAGVSAEVIGLPSGTIGERLNLAKLYLATGDLFAWTAVIVALGFGTEKLVLWATGRGQRAMLGA